MTRTLLLAVAIVVLGAATAARAQPVGGIERVAWLQGCWEMTSAQGTVEEQWMAPRGESMIAVNRTIRGNRLVGYELVVLRVANERLAYEAHPSGQASAVFLSHVVTDSTVVFENPEHDFPQRIGYEDQGADSLLAWIEGGEPGRTRRIEFPYRRALCPGLK